jgi:DNA (cytosine-5)-methyltransferase 1
MNELALFAGSGGGILGGHLLGWRTIAAVEIEDYPRRVLLQRQADGLLPRFPIWDDICTFDGKPWRGRVDVISGGFPCQDISAAGKGDGLDGERSGLWTHMARVVSEVRPPFVFVENSPMLTTRGGTRVIADLTQMGYDTTWTVMGAADIGAPHQRDRMWIVARQREFLSHSQHNGDGRGKQQQESPTQETRFVANPSSFGGKTRLADTQGREEGYANQSQHSSFNLANTRSVRYKHEDNKIQTRGNSLEPCSTNLANTEDKGDVWREWELGFTQQEYNSRGSPIDGSGEWWSVEPSVGRVAHGVAHRVDRLKAIGNGQVPLCAATAWRLLTKDWELML